MKEKRNFVSEKENHSEVPLEEEYKKKMSFLLVTVKHSKFLLFLSRAIQTEEEAEVEKVVAGVVNADGHVGEAAEEPLQLEISLLLPWLAALPRSGRDTLRQTHIQAFYLQTRDTTSDRNTWT